MLSFFPLKQQPVERLALNGTLWNDHIDGCYRRISVMQLVLIWWLYHEKYITPRQLRVYFALHEMHERRRALPGHRKPSYGPQELRRLVGARDDALLPDEALMSDVRRLQAVGVITFDRAALSFTASPDAIRVDDLGGFWQMFDAIVNRRRVLHLPRRLVRTLAGGMSRAVAGTLIAMLIRCLYCHPNGNDTYRVDGRAKASWIAETFGLSVRAVKEARTRLVEVGLISELPTTQIEMNRWGGRYQVNLDWSPASAIADGNAVAVDKSPPHPPETTDNIGRSAPLVWSETPPICTPNKEEQNSLLTKDFKNRTPSEARLAVVSMKQDQDEDSSRAVKPAKLHDMTPEDLFDFYRLLVLYYQACRKGLAREGDYGRLQFFSLAERAKAHGKNRCRLFAWMLKRQRFDLISDADEEKAHAWIKAKFYGIERRYAPSDHAHHEQQREETYALMRNEGMV